MSSPTDQIKSQTEQFEEKSAYPQATHYPSQYRSSTPTENVAPAAPQPEPWASIPQELQSLPQWVLADADKRPWTTDGRAASVNNPATWCDLDTATRAAQAKGMYIGYVLTAEDPFICIDLDVKEKTSQEHLDRFKTIIETFDSYTEQSRGGLGWHVWCTGESGSGIRRDGVEVYSQARFIVCTGNVERDRPIADRSDLLATLVGEIQASRPTVEIELSGVDSPDWALANRAVFDEGELGRLFRGEWEGRYPSQSEADLALIKLLLPRVDSNMECWRTFRLSVLGKREKAARSDYIKSTITLATLHLTNDAVAAAEGHELVKGMFWRNDNPRHFRLLSDNDLAHISSHGWLVKKIIPENSVGVIYGHSGTFKSFLALDIMAHISNGKEWFGNRVKAAPAVYVPFEGHGGIPKRVAAWKHAHKQQGNHNATTNMRFITDPMNLRDKHDRDKLVDTLVENEWAGGVLCIDTLAQAGAGIDENSSQGMGEMIAIFQEMQLRLGGTIMVIHHSGKVESAGMRGWSGLRGALDFSIKCQKEEGKKASKLDAQFVLEKVKEDEEGKVFDFSMLRVQLGFDEDGDEISSLSVIPRVNPQVTDPVSDVMRDKQDDDFIWQWVKEQVDAGNYPSRNSLSRGDRSAMQEQRTYLTERKILASIDRLMAASRLETPKEKSPANASWIRAVDWPQGYKS